MSFKKSASGMYWDVVFNGIMIQRFFTKREARQFINDHAALVGKL